MYYASTLDVRALVGPGAPRGMMDKRGVPKVAVSPRAHLISWTIVVVVVVVLGLWGELLWRKVIKFPPPKPLKISFVGIEKIEWECPYALTRQKGQSLAILSPTTIPANTIALTGSLEEGADIQSGLD